MLPNSFYSSSELGLCFYFYFLFFLPFEVQNPNLYVIVTLLQTPFFGFHFDILASSFWGKVWSLGLGFYFFLFFFKILHKQRSFCLFCSVFLLLKGDKPQRAYFYHWFLMKSLRKKKKKKKSFKQRLCLACNTLCALCLLESIHISTCHTEP